MQDSKEAIPSLNFTGPNSINFQLINRTNFAHKLASCEMIKLLKFYGVFGLRKSEHGSVRRPYSLIPNRRHVVAPSVRPAQLSLRSDVR